MQPPHSLTGEGWYFVTTTTHQRRRFFSDDEIAKNCLEELQKAISKTESHLFCYVLMPDHFHMIVQSNRLPTLMHGFKGCSARRLRVRWQGGYWERGIRDERDLWQTVNYIHMNPVKAGFAEKPEDYLYSSVRQFLDKYGNTVF